MPEIPMPEIASVDWHSYAAVYDVMAENNPAYADLVNQFEDAIALWPVRSGSVLADLGAGTGTFSLGLAEAFPSSRVVHLDASSEMNRLAQRKATARHLTNVTFATTDILDSPFEDESLAAIVTVHALYAFARPREVISAMFAWLQPGGQIFACNPGRPPHVAEWAVYLARESLRRQGLWRTTRLLYRSRVVAQQNRMIAKAQRTGTYWTHTSGQFRAAFESVGFQVHTARTTYRGHSDLIIATKPPAA